MKIKPVNDYSDDYQKVVDDEEAKMKMNEIIEIKDINVNLDEYDRILLGTGGLVRAYSEATQQAIEKSIKIKKVQGIEIEVGLDYANLDIFKYYCKKNN